MGKLSRLYKGLKNKDQKVEIANDFQLPSTILSSWLIYLTNVRNICAHHSRLWNKKVSADRPVIPTRKIYKFNGDIPTDFNTTVYGIFSITDRLLHAINPSNHFITKILGLMNQYPAISTKAMGFVDDWKTNAAWLKYN